MPQNPSMEKSRRAFLKSVIPAAAGAAALGALSPSPAAAAAQATLQVWSCGGLAEAMMPANQAFEELFGVKIIYTGAFAAALGKSLMGNGRTEVFAGRVLDLAKNLRKAGRMRSFIPLCYTSYVIVTPKGNPAGIKTLEDMTRPGVRVAIAQQASVPGGAAVNALLTKAGVLDKLKANFVENGTCVQRSVELVCSGKADAMVVEPRIPRMPLFAPHLDVVEIPAEFFPPPPLTFTVGIMEEAGDVELAGKYQSWICAPDGGGPFFEKAGFITPYSERGKAMTEKFGVRDV